MYFYNNLQFGLQDGVSTAMWELTCYHDYIMLVMLVIVVFITYMLFYMMLFSLCFHKYLSEGIFIETIWSIIPAILILALVVPSMVLLFEVEDLKSPFVTIKVMAHQWYWSYFFPFLFGFKLYIEDFFFTSFMISSFLKSYDIISVFPRLLEADMAMYMPYHTLTRLVVSSTDVIHSFSIPSMALKVDALPGRINQLSTFPLRLGAFFGQCSEICGANHSFMPIFVKVVPLTNFVEFCLIGMDFSVSFLD